MNMFWALLAMAFGGFGVAPAVADQGNPQFQSLTNSFNTAIIQSQKDQVVIDADNPPAKTDPQPDAPVVKGIYVTAYSAGGARMKELLELTDSTELNAMVIDIKDDLGYITYPTENKALQKMGKSQPFIRDIDALMKRLQKHEVYPIARVVVFKDTILAKKNPELSFRNKDGSVWANGKGDSFVNPYSKEVWDYNIEIAKEAAKLGFKEIQFDYVRFPEGFETRADVLKYTKSDKSRVDVVAEFVQYARKELAPLGVRVSVDIFGYAASVPAAEGIGQDFVKISENVDVISPMVYPSHYSTGWYGVKDLTKILTQPSRVQWKIHTRNWTLPKNSNPSFVRGSRTSQQAGWAVGIMSSMARNKWKTRLER